MPRVKKGQERILGPLSRPRQVVGGLDRWGSGGTHARPDAARSSRKSKGCNCIDARAGLAREV